MVFSDYYIRRYLSDISACKIRYGTSFQSHLNINPMDSETTAGSGVFKYSFSLLPESPQENYSIEVTCKSFRDFAPTSSHQCVVTSSYHLMFGGSALMPFCLVML